MQNQVLSPHHGLQGSNTTYSPNFPCLWQQAPYQSKNSPNNNFRSSTPTGPLPRRPFCQICFPFPFSLSSKSGKPPILFTAAWQCLPHYFKKGKKETFHAFLPGFSLLPSRLWILYEFCMLCKFNMSILLSLYHLSTVDGRFTLLSKFRSMLLLRKISNICMNADILSQ